MQRQLSSPANDDRLDAVPQHPAATLQPLPMPKSDIYPAALAPPWLATTEGKAQLLLQVHHGGL